MTAYANTRRIVSVDPPTGDGRARRWGRVAGDDVHRFEITNTNGLILRATNYGAAITELHIPDIQGRFADVVLGGDSLDTYTRRRDYLGAIVGRCANRVDTGVFALNGSTHTLENNGHVHHLHGGPEGFDRRVWHGRLLRTPDGAAVRFTRLSPDGEAGYPGALSASITYTLTGDNRLITDITATADAPTLCNLVQHNYWNLAGHDSGSVEAHTLTLNARTYTPSDDALLPTGEIAPVDQTPFDFTRPKPIGSDIERAGGDPPGYDVNFVIDGPEREFRRVAELRDPASGRALTLSANMPGLQLYTANFFDGSLIGKGGARYNRHAAVCLETQFFPNAVNIPHWTSPILAPGQVYHHRMVAAFDPTEPD